MFVRTIVIGLLLSATASPLLAGEWSGYVAAEFRWFPNDPSDPPQYKDTNLSAAFRPEYAHQWDKGRQSFSFIGFGRIDQHDDERTHGDIRELLYIKAAENWELQAGIGKEYWAVTEFRRLTDIINQDDEVEVPDRREKLGQPMVNFALVQDWGTLGFFVLPYFRERTFPGVEGRLRTIPRVDVDNPVYESSDEDKHIDYALRYAHTFNEWDVGLYYFDGTGRDPRLVPGLNSSGEDVLIPHYDLIEQYGLDLQGTFDEWLWKLEAIYRSGQGPDPEFWSASGGFEHTFFGVKQSDVDVGLLLEYIWDERGRNATTPFDNDWFVATRITLNDVDSSELLAGFVIDGSSQAHSLYVQGSRRFGDNWKLDLNARTFQNLTPADPGYSFRNDDYVQLQLFYYF